MPSLIPQALSRGGVINKQEPVATQFLQVVKALCVIGTEGNIGGAILIIGLTPKLASQEIEIAHCSVNIQNGDANSKNRIHNSFYIGKL